MTTSTPQSCAIAIDIGGTKIASAFIDPATPTTVHARATRPTRAAEGADVVMSEVTAAIEQAIAQARAEGYTPSCIGIGAPGVVDTRSGTITHAGPTMPGWEGTAIVEALRPLGIPTFVHNDVRMMGLGETVHGAAAGMQQDILFVSIGTGIGGAIISDGQLRSSPHHTRGEIGYLLAPSPDGGCDTIENIGSGPALARTYDEGIELPEIMRRYHDGEPKAHELIESSMRCVGHGLAAAVSAIDVQAIIIGGGVGTLGDPILNPLTQGIRAGLLPPLRELPILAAALGTNAPLVGAAHYAQQQHSPANFDTP